MDISKLPRAIRRKLYVAFELYANYTEVTALPEKLQSCYKRMVRAFGNQCKIQADKASQSLACNFSTHNPQTRTSTEKGSVRVYCTRRGNFKVSCRMGKKEANKVCKHERDVTHFIEACLDL